MLKPKERVFKLMQGELPDRVPVVCNLFDQGARELGLSIEEYYSRGEYVAEGQLRLAQKFGHDQLWAFHYTANDAEMLGSRYTVFSDKGPPNVGDMIIKSEQDIYDLEISDSLFETKPYRELEKTFEILNREAGDSYPILGSVVGSYSMPAILMGMERWFDLLYGGGSDKAVKTLLDKCSRFCSKKTKALLDMGVDMVSYVNPLASAEFITAQGFREEALQWILKDLEEPGSARMVYFNGGGPINPMLESIVNDSGFHAFYINPYDDVKEAKRITKGKGILIAPINDILLRQYSEEQIREEVTRIIREGKEGGSFMFGTLMMPYEISDQNIMTMIETAKAAGSYV